MQKGTERARRLIPRLILAAALICGVLPAPAKPLVLVFQERVTDFTAEEPNLSVMAALAQTLEDSGRVFIVIWSEQDPLMSAALESARMSSLPDKANRKDAFRMAGVLKADYVLICRAHLVTGLGREPPEKHKEVESGGLVEGRAELYRGRGGRPIWTNDETVSIVRDNKLDAENTALSIANTWTIKMIAGPFRSLPGGPGVETPAPGEPTVTHAPALPVDAAPLENGRRALDDGRIGEAVALLRDAVDADPFDPEARLALVEALQKAERPFLAADEATRAAALMPGVTALLLSAAECWIAGDQPNRAFEMTASALEKDPGNAAAHALLGDLYVGRLEYGKAIDSYTKAIALLPDAETYYRRAQAFALMEEFGRSLEDLAEAQNIGLSAEPDKLLKRYEGAVRVLTPVFQSLAAAVRNLLAEAQMSPDNQDVKRRADDLQGRCRAFGNYLDRITATEGHKKSHDRRALAVNLLLQSAMGLQRYVEDHDLETRGDANLLQIEAMREFAAAQQLFQAEQARPR
ncbi:MAG: hypothetical protein IH851_11300 [Armatimonadetes bacterium]|nr:hypothetical protein [Armatimonadota bacterium]